MSKKHGVMHFEGGSDLPCFVGRKNEYPTVEKFLAALGQYPEKPRPDKVTEGKIVYCVGGFYCGMSGDSAEWEYGNRRHWHTDPDGDVPVWMILDKDFEPSALPHLRHPEHPQS